MATSNRPPGRRGRRGRGQSLVEFALIAPVLMSLVLITLDFSRVFMSYVTLTNATRVAANYAALDSGTLDQTTYGQLVGRETGNLDCTVQPDAGGKNPPLPTFPDGTGLNASAVVTMTCHFHFITPFIDNFFGGFLPITATSQFPIRTGAVANIGGPIVIPPPGGPTAGFNFVGVSGGSIDGSGNVSGTGTVSVNVQDTSANAQTWNWNWGDGSPSDTNQNPATHAYNSPGTYTVTQTVTNGVGSSTMTRTVTVTSVVVPPPVAGFYGVPQGSPPFASGGGSGGAPIQGTRTLTVQFFNTSTNGTAFSWDFGDGSNSTSSAPSHQYTQLGVFTVTLTVTSPTGGTPQTRTAYVTTGCVVPNFANSSTADAQSTWNSSGITGTVRYLAQGAKGNGSTKAPSPAATIVSQSVPGGTFIPATKQGNGPWQCVQDITLVYAP